MAMFKKNQSVYTMRAIDMRATGGPLMPNGTCVHILTVRRDGRLWVDCGQYGKRHLLSKDVA